MTDSEKLMAFAKFLRDKNYDEDVINYNILVVKLLINSVLRVFDQRLESIDTYCFEEFTDMAGIIDDYLGGREGIPKMLDAMLELTEFLKINKLIKGGKIAHYKRMFSKKEYYLSKYDMITGRKDDTKEFIKDITTNRFSSTLIKLLEDINVYEIKTINKIDKLLNDVPLTEKESKEDISILKYMLIDLELMEKKNNHIEVTKKGRALSRLSAEERYAAIANLVLFRINWDGVLKMYDNVDYDYLKFKKIIHIMSSIFTKTKEVVIEPDVLKNLSEEDILIEISSERFRIAKIESYPYGYRIMDICFKGMGLIEIKPGSNGEIIYSVTPLGETVFKLAYNECSSYVRDGIECIKFIITNKKYEEAEINILEFLSVYGGNIIVWDYLGQILMLKKNYRYAYIVLKHAYENSSKRGKAAKSALYHLVLCCRKLKLEADAKNYEMLLQKLV